MKTGVWAWIEPETGRLLRAQVTARDVRMGTRPFVAEIGVDFKDDKKVGMPGRESSRRDDRRDDLVIW